MISHKKVIFNRINSFYLFFKNYKTLLDINLNKFATQYYIVNSNVLPFSLKHDIDEIFVSLIFVNYWEYQRSCKDFLTMIGA
jgi:hypothetical protein